MNIQADSFEDYFTKSYEYEADLRALDSIIRKNAPHLKPAMFENMGGGAGLAYGLVPYKSKSMKETSQWPLLALARQKHFMALYACAIIDGTYIAERYGQKLGKVSVGKSCIRFKRLADLDMENLIALIKDIDTRHHNGEMLYGQA